MEENIVEDKVCFSVQAVVLQLIIRRMPIDLIILEENEQIRKKSALNPENLVRRMSKKV